MYGKCIFTDYNNVHKNQCATEFMRLKECYLVLPPLLPLTDRHANMA
jgi:hypothetical protein